MGEHHDVAQYMIEQGALSITGIQDIAALKIQVSIFFFVIVYKLIQSTQYFCVCACAEYLAHLHTKLSHSQSHSGSQIEKYVWGIPHMTMCLHASVTKKNMFIIKKKFNAIGSLTCSPFLICRSMGDIMEFPLRVKCK